MPSFFGQNPPDTEVGSTDATESTIAESATTETDTAGGFYQGSPTQTVTEAFEEDARQAKVAAEAAKVAAEAAKNAAETSEASAVSAAANAASSEAAASSSAANAANSATAASSSESAAASSASSASSSAASAAASETNAAASEAAAAISASSASNSATNAATSASNAAADALTASNQASAATSSAANAASSATAAMGSESSATASAQAALLSELAASSSATSASTSATSAASSASNAATSEANASASESAAATSATNAAASAIAASASAVSAATQAAAASGSASGAATSASNAAASAASAATSESNAATSEANAALSETNAAASESAAAASESAAASSASSAATSETNAATSASNAAGSASNAATSESNAATSAAEAAASFDAFDDRYLGAKSAEPALDNDGNALTVGALFFDTTAGVMKVWSGASWQIAYSLASVALQIANNLSDLADTGVARSNLGLGTSATTDASSYATSAQGALADSAVQPGDNVSTLTNDANYATVSQVDTAVANLVSSAPATLDTLNELASALGNDPNFATTVSNQIGLKLDSATWTASAASGISSTQVSNWDVSYSWGDHSAAGYLTSALAASTYQPILVSGTSIKTVNGQSVLGSGNIQIDGGVTSFNTRTGAVTLSSGDVTTALGFTPYDSTNPSGYITSSALSSYLPLSGGTLTGDLTVSGNGFGINFSGGNNRIYFGGYRAIEGNASGTQLQIGEGYSATYLQSGTIYATSSNHVLLHAGNYGTGYFKTINGSSIIGSGDLTVSGTDSTKLPLSGGTLSGTIYVGTSGSGSNVRALRVGPSGASPASFGSYAGSWRSAIEIWDNAATRMLHLTPPDGTNYNYSSIKSTDAGLRIDVGAAGGTNAIDIGTNGVANFPQGLQLSGVIGRSTSVAGFFQGTYNNVGDNSARSNPIYTIGSNYNPADTTLSNMYGVGYAHPNASFISGPGFTGGWGMYVAADGNARVWLEASNGRVESVGDMRSPIFYDRNNTGYYIDPSASTSLRTVGDWRANSHDWTGEYAGKIQYHSSNWYFQFASQWIMRNSGGSNVSYGDTSGNMWAVASMRSPIFYDNDNTGYYCDPTGSSRLTTIYCGNVYNDLGGWFRNYGATGLYNQSYGNHWYSDAAQYWNLTFGGQTHGGIRFRDAHDGTLRGYVYADTSNNIGFLSNTGGWRARVVSGDWFLIEGSSIRAPLYYDSNNTSYYFRPASTDTGNLRGRLNFADYGAGIVGTYSSYRYQLVYAMGPAYQGALDGTSVSGGYGLWYSHPNAGGVASNLSTHGLMNIVNGSFHASLDASMRAVTDMRSPIYYDIGNTGYYVDAASTSYLYSLILSGASYFRPSNWIQLDGAYGLYWPNHYGLHVRANDQSTYTQLCIQGSKNSYGGILDLYSNVNGIMYDSGGNGGVYREANGRWYLYHHVGNNCMGVGTSTTSSSYYMYVGGSIYSTGNVVAYSDARKKTNIVTVDSALDKVAKLRGVYYNRIRGSDPEIDPDRREIGVIAQEVNEVLPEVVTYAKDVDEYGVQYGNFAGLFIEAFKELQAEIKSLRAEVLELRGRLGE